MQAGSEVGFPVASSPPLTDVGTPDLYWGTWAQGLAGEWWETSPDLVWPQSIITYGKMRHDPQLRGVLSAFAYPILRATWTVDGTGCRDEVTQRVSDDFGLPVLGDEDEGAPARRGGIVWQRHLRQAVNGKLVFGHAVFERRYEIRGDGAHLVSLGQRMPWTIAALQLNSDGSVKSLEQNTQDQPITANRLVWYVNEMEGSAWVGMSALRAAFGAWLLKHETWRVNATSIRRFGMGVPTVEAPAGASATQISQAQQLASAMRAGDQSGAGLPAGFAFKLAGLTGSVPDALGFIKYLDQQMSKMALAGLLDLGQTEIGSRALGETFLDLFLLSLQFLADDVATEATTGYPGMPGAVVDLVTQNWGEDEPVPRIICHDVGEQHEVTAQSIQQLMAWGALTQDPELEKFVRRAWRFPQRTTPQPPPQATGHPAPNAPPAPDPAPAESPPAPAPRGNPPAAAAGPDGLRRHLTPTEVRAGFDAITVRSQLQAELDLLLSAWPQVFRAQRDSLVDQVADLVDDGKIAKLAALTVDTSDGAGLLAAAMTRMASTAASQFATEAARQGVHVDTSKVKVSASGLSKIAAARAALAGQYVAAQAGTRAMQMVAASAGTDAADYVGTQLDGLSQVSLRDQLAAALQSAQNSGRLAAMELVDPSFTDVQYVATEVLDENTCDPCRDIDGSTWPSLADAQNWYPSGGFIDCAGYDRCRGTVMAVYGNAEEVDVGDD